MRTIKKLFLYTLLILFFISVHQDLTVGTPLNMNPEPQNNTKFSEQKNMTVIKTQVSQGDTVLSIVERINDNTNHNSDLNVSQILDDFKTLNPGVKPTDIKHGDYYYFPLY